MKDGDINKINLVTLSSTEKTQRATELRNQISVDLSDFSVDLSVSF